ncbi:hypothetical protein PR202_ga03307 [Eleusine coracana subsp. coracana]|uniref:Uncharacterized protein n=1 Tax=Eleusine coracana subsp. coracana TaxID=191504 RepID=A0AAV5BM17_ELECO|nr:hypothetical protein PR202_ga03307 [Eleusine coracana subsp. coracana]
MDHERLNSPSTSAISLEVMGHRLHISQDPNSKHLGTTVWDASMVFVKFLETNSRKGRFCPSKLKGKRVIELGAGCGLAGFGMALLGCDVITTDQVEVLPLLMRNVERNKSWISQSNSDSGSLGSITVAELDWGNKDHIEAVVPPFDYIIGTDVVYSEHLLQPLLETITALSGPKTKILMDAKYRHPSIHLYMMDPKAPLATEAGVGDNGNDDDEEDVSNLGEDEGDPGVNNESCSGFQESKSGNLDDWEIRRTAGVIVFSLEHFDVEL